MEIKFFETSLSVSYQTVFTLRVPGEEEVSEASWRLSWTISEHFRICWREDGEQEGQDGDQEGQHGDQERQDEPT